MRAHLLIATLVSLTLLGCAAPPPSPPAPTPEARTAAARATFAKGMGAALNGDMSTALRHFDTVDGPALGPKERAALDRATTHLRSDATKRAHAGLEPWVANVLRTYQAYWVRVMTARSTPAAGERELADALAPLVGLPARGASTMQAIEPLLQKEIAARGYHSLHGVTPPYREFMLWRTQVDQDYRVVLPEGTESVSVSVSMLDDFSSLGWLGFATGDYFHSGGWATKERLFCVRSAYDLESETFRVSYLGHEAQHFADYKRFPTLQAPELEYRAKLVEIAQADSSQAKLLGAFTHNGSDSRDNPHGHANRHLVRELSAALAVKSTEGNWWESVPPAQIRAAALKVLQDDSRQRAAR